MSYLAQKEQMTSVRDARKRVYYYYKMNSVYIYISWKILSLSLSSRGENLIAVYHNNNSGNKTDSYLSADAQVFSWLPHTFDTFSIVTENTHPASTL